MEIFGRSIRVHTPGDAIWNRGGPYNGRWVAEQMTLSSLDTRDAYGNTGAHNVILRGLDSEWRELTETVQLNGVMPVQTTQSFLRVNSAVVNDCGIEGKNCGEIRIWNAVSGNHYAMISPGEGVSCQAVYTVPDGFGVDLVGYGGQLGGPPGSWAVLGICYKPWGLANRVIRPFRLCSCGRYWNERPVSDLYVMHPFTGKTDITVIVLSSSGEELDIMAELFFRTYALST